LAKPAVEQERLGLDEEEGKKREGRGAWIERVMRQQVRKNGPSLHT
jgi:hypothetical protein